MDRFEHPYEYKTIKSPPGILWGPDASVFQPLDNTDHVLAKFVIKHLERVSDHMCASNNAFPLGERHFKFVGAGNNYIGTLRDEAPVIMDILTELSTDAETIYNTLYPNGMTHDDAVEALLWYLKKNMPSDSYLLMNQLHRSYSDLISLRHYLR